MVKAWKKLDELYEVEETMNYVELPQEDDNVPAVQDDSQEMIVQEEEQDNKEYYQDIDYAKSNLRNILDEGESALSQMRGIAQATEHPRAYEVMATMMRTMVDANKSLVDISEKKSKPKEKKKENSEGSNTTNNNVILTGNAQDALEQLNEMRRKKDEG